MSFEFRLEKLSLKAGTEARPTDTFLPLLQVGQQIRPCRVRLAHHSLLRRKVSLWVADRFTSEPRTGETPVPPGLVMILRGPRVYGRLLEIVFPRKEKAEARYSPSYILRARNEGKVGEQASCLYMHRLEACAPDNTEAREEVGIVKEFDTRYTLS